MHQLSQVNSVIINLFVLVHEHVQRLSPELRLVTVIRLQK